MPKDRNRSAGDLPPRQHTVDRLLRWGTEHPTIGSPVPKIDLESWTLSVEGDVEQPLRLSWNDILGLPSIESRSDFHCVEGWSVKGLKWEGIRFTQISVLAKPRKAAKFVLFECADGYTTSFTLSKLSKDDVLLAYKVDGKYLEPGIGAPLRLVAPSKYAYKSAMWITKITFSPKEKLGYWEARGYSNTADVWKNDRFSRQKT